MKKFILYFAIALSSTAHAYDSSLEPKKAMEELSKTDCSKSLSECRYYATVEYLAFFSGCRALIGKYEGRVIPDEEWKEVTNLLDNWSIFKDSKLKRAVLRDNNPLKERLNQDISAYLQRIAIGEAMMECERIGLVKENAKPENMSDILQSTLNYTDWRRSKGDKFLGDK